MVLAPLGLLIWQVGKQYRQEQRNHALIIAIKAQSRRQVEDLLAEGADANAHDTGATPSFFQALRRLFVSVGKPPAPVDPAQHPSALILASGWVAVNSSDGSTVLKDEDDRHDEEIVMDLLDHGANPYVVGKVSPIDFAIFKGQHLVLRRLLERGANPHIRDTEYPDYDYELSGNPPIVYAAASGDIEAMRLLVEHGADVNATNAIGLTPLMAGAQSGTQESVLWLLQYGAKPGATDRSGQTALSTALDRVKLGGDPDSRKIATLLKQYGATK